MKLIFQTFLWRDKCSKKSLNGQIDYGDTFLLPPPVKSFNDQINDQQSLEFWYLLNHVCHFL